MAEDGAGVFRASRDHPSYSSQFLTHGKGVSMESQQRGLRGTLRGWEQMFGIHHDLLEHRLSQDAVQLENPLIAKINFFWQRSQTAFLGQTHLEGLSLSYLGMQIFPLRSRVERP